MELNKQNSEFKCIITFFNKKKGIMFSLTNKNLTQLGVYLFFFTIVLLIRRSLSSSITHTLSALSPIVIEMHFFYLEF